MTTQTTLFEFETTAYGIKLRGTGTKDGWTADEASQRIINALRYREREHAAKRMGRAWGATYWAQRRAEAGLNS